jgi:hypothetical protein
VTQNIVRLTATLGAAAVIGLAGTALAGTASAAPATSSAAASSASVQGSHFIDWYPDKESCQVGGEYYIRHGYSDYICQLDSLRGWALYVLD